MRKLFDCFQVGVWVMQLTSQYAINFARRLGNTHYRENIPEETINEFKSEINNLLQVMDVDYDVFSCTEENFIRMHSDLSEKFSDLEHVAYDMGGNAFSVTIGMGLDEVDYCRRVLESVKSNLIALNIPIETGELLRQGLPAFSERVKGYFIQREYLELQNAYEQFDKIFQAVSQQIADNKEIIQCLEALRDSVLDSRMYRQKYNDFVASAANHMAIISPFLAYLQQYL